MKHITRRDFTIGGLSAIALGTMFDADAADKPELASAKKWFREAQYGMMIHWGLYSIIGGEWKGRLMAQQYIAEWAQQYFRIPNAEYEKLAAAFNPIFFNADEWVKTAVDAGMKYLVFTSKHHDGFAMFRSKASKYNVVDATPFGRDVIEELAEACRKYGLKLGLYYSQDLDWHERGGGGFTLGKTWTDNAAYWTNNWDFKEVTRKDFDEYFETKAKAQVKEILTQYGDIGLIWFDIGATLTENQSNELYQMVRKLQPGCLINSRIGCGECDYVSAGDNEVIASKGKDILFETPATTNDSWGYKPTDQNWKTPARLRRDREHLKSIGANYLLNIGPDPFGRLPVPAVKAILAAK